MKRRPQDDDRPAISFKKALVRSQQKIGFVLSGGGSRAAYQVGAIKALIPHLEQSQQAISVIVGSSIGAVNGLILAACLKNGISQAIEELENLWRERTFRNTFSGSPSRAFLRAIRMGFFQYLAPGPNATSQSIFDPTPLMNRMDSVIEKYGGLSAQNRAPSLEAVAVMTTIEGAERKPLLFLSSSQRLEPEILHGASFQVCYVDALTAKHGFASAALPSVLPPVELDTEHGKVRLVDGGISQNIPVDPAVRMGAERVVVVDVSGRNWWLDQYKEAHDTRPTWEVPASLETFCLRPPETFVTRCQKPIGPLFRDTVKSSTGKFIAAVGPTWPVFTLLKNKMGEDIAYEVMSYVALDPDYIHALIERGYDETTALLRNRVDINFRQSESYESWVQTL